MLAEEEAGLVGARGLLGARREGEGEGVGALREVGAVARAWQKRAERGLVEPALDAGAGGGIFAVHDLAAEAELAGFHLEKRALRGGPPELPFRRRLAQRVERRAEGGAGAREIPRPVEVDAAEAVEAGVARRADAAADLARHLAQPDADGFEPEPAQVGAAGVVGAVEAGERVGVVGRLRPLAEEFEAADGLGGAAHVHDLFERRLREPLARHVVAARRPDPRVDDAVHGLAAAPVLACSFGHAREADAEDDAVGRARGREVRVGDARERGVAAGVEHKRRLGVVVDRRRAVDEHLGVAGGGDGVEVGFGEALLVGELLAVGLAEHGDAERDARAAVGRALEKGELGVGAEQAARKAGGGVLEVDLDAALGGDEAARGEGDLGRGVVDHVVGGLAALQELAVEVDALGAGEHHDKGLAALPAQPVRPLHGLDGGDLLALVEAARDGAGHAHPPPRDEPVADARHVGRDGGALDFAAKAGELARAVGEVHVAEAGLAGARVELDVDAVDARRGAAWSRRAGWACFRR